MRDLRPAVSRHYPSKVVRQGQKLRRTSGGTVGDLPQGLVAVGALLGMLAFGLSPWLAIPLAIITYAGVMLLRTQPAVSPLPPDDESPPDLSSNDTPMGADQSALREAAFAAHFGLTRAEREILPLLAHRLTDQEIAQRRFTSHRTVSNQTASILGKLGITSRREVANIAAQYGLEFPPLPPMLPE